MKNFLYKLLLKLKEHKTEVVIIAVILLATVLGLVLITVFIPELWGLLALVAIAVFTGIIPIEIGKQPMQQVPQPDEHIYYYIQEALFNAMHPIFMALGHGEEKFLKENHVKPECRVAQIEKGFAYKYGYVLPFNLSVSAKELQHSLNSELYQQHQIGCYIPIALQVQIKDNRLLIVATTVCTENEWHQENDRLQAATQHYSHEVKDSDF